MNHFEDFKGTIGRTHKESTPWWPEPKGFGKDYPNVIVILLDDTGFAQLGCYGSTIETPNFDRLAEGGLRYNNFYTTPLCSPTRACLLTGRNHHSVGMRSLANFDSGYPHMRGEITPHAATIAEILRDNGYSTFAVGKWHLARSYHGSAAGPFDQWPLQRGFNRYYGFLDGMTDQYYPQLVYDNHPILPPKGPEEGYHLTEDLVDKSIEFIRNHISIYPTQPFFLYLSFGATHAPFHVPKEYVDKYKGRFDAGWDVVREQWYKRQLEIGIIPPNTKLAPRNPGVEPWETLSDNEKRFFLKLQEVFAGFLDHTDHHVGRLLDFLDELKISDNTMIFLLSDNGAANGGGKMGLISEMKNFNGLQDDIDKIQDRIDDIGSPNTNPFYPWGWAQAGNSPLKWYKTHTFGGGIRDPLIIYWPNHIKDGGNIRKQFHHVSDIVPTILDVLKIDPPSTYKGLAQIPISGTSMAYTFDSADEPSHKKVQYFEMIGHRGISSDGWKAVTNHQPGKPYDDDEWELYNLIEDFSECNNLAEKYPEKLRELLDLWRIEVGKYGVLPLDDRRAELWRIPPRPGSPHYAREYTYYPPVTHLPAGAGPPFGARSWLMQASIERINEQIEGVIITSGTHNNGLSWYIKDNRLVFDYNAYRDHSVIRSSVTVPTGQSTIGIKFRRKERGGTFTLLIDGNECGSIDVPLALRIISTTGLQIGINNLSPITNDYKAPFKFMGKIKYINFKSQPSNPTLGELKNRFDAEMTKQ
ncbi:MAG: arylsulfatase [Thermoplasmata archaeon]|nr:MAG: arylsulfatase [Thermoplasmata archaeon]